MTPIELINAIKTEIETAVKDYSLAAEGQGNKPITVYAQHIPDECFESDTYYPLVVAAINKIEDADDSSYPALSKITVGLTFGVYGEDEKAWVDLLNVMERTRQRLMDKRLLVNRYQLQFPVKWETIEAQPYPFWFGYGTLEYSTPRPIQTRVANIEGGRLNGRN